MCEDIMIMVSRFKTKYAKAVLTDYFRSKIVNEVYPGLIYKEGSTVSGIVYLDLSTLSLNRLDMFEGDLYKRKNVSVTLENGHLIRAMTFITKPEFHDILTGKPWSLEKFKAEDKKPFLDGYKGFEKL